MNIFVPDLDFSWPVPTVDAVVVIVNFSESVVKELVGQTIFELFSELVVSNTKLIPVFAPVVRLLIHTRKS